MRHAQTCPEKSSTSSVKSLKLKPIVYVMASLFLCNMNAMATEVTTPPAVNVYAQMPSITVYAERQNHLPAAVTSIDRENLDKTGVSNMADVVKYLPLVQAPFSVYGGGTYIDSAGTSSYNIRGVDANRIGLDIDGIDLAEASSSPYMPPASMNKRGAGRDYVEPEMLQSVDIVSGTTDAATDGIGGRVSFKNKAPNDYLSEDKSVAASLKTAYNSVDESWLTSLTGAIGNEQFKALVAYAHREGHQTDGNSDTKAFAQDWDLDAALANLQWNINEAHRLNFVVDHYQKQADTLGMDASAFVAFKTDTATQHQDIQRNTISLEHQYHPTQDGWLERLTTKVWHQKSENETRTIYDTGSYIRDFLNAYQQDTTGLKLDAQSQAGAHLLKYGLVAEKKDYSSDRQEQRSNGKPAPFTGTYLTDSSLERYALYVSDQMRFSVADRDLTLTPSVRVEHQKYKPEASGSNIASKDFTYIAPSLSLAYAISPQSYSYFKYARGARVPSPMEMGGSYETSNGATYLVMGNSNLKKETSDAFELGFKNSSLRGVQFDLTTFYTTYKDFIDYFDHGSSVDGYWMLYRAENIADAKIWGAELSTRVDLGEYVPHADGFSLALVAGKSKGSAENKQGLKTGMNSVQPEKASLTFAFDDPNRVFGLGLTATAVGAKTASLDVSTFQTGDEQKNYRPVAGYTVFDLAGYWNINSSTKLNVALNNMFDRTYWNYASVGTLDANSKASIIDRSAQPGRHIMASIEFKH